MKKGRLARLVKLGGMTAGLVGDAAGAVAHRVHETAQEATARLHRDAALVQGSAFGLSTPRPRMCKVPTVS